MFRPLLWTLTLIFASCRHINQIKTGTILLIILSKLTNYNDKWVLVFFCFFKASCMSVLLLNIWRESTFSFCQFLSLIKQSLMECPRYPTLLFTAFMVLYKNKMSQAEWSIHQRNTDNTVILLFMNIYCQSEKKKAVNGDPDLNG